MSKRRYFLLDENLSLNLRPLFGRKADVVSMRELKPRARDEAVIEEAFRREAGLVTNDDGLVEKYKKARCRKTEDACYPGLIHLRSNLEEVQMRLLRRILRRFVWNEVIENCTSRICRDSF
jgi:predicted nuclease of predicted toxin-antitoxin system